MKKFTKEELMNTYIVNDCGELREKYVNACISAGYEHQRSNLKHSLSYYVLPFISNNSEWPWERAECIGQTNSQGAISNCTEITLKDFKDTPTTPELNWDESPEGYDYWVVPKKDGFPSGFRYLRDGGLYSKGGRYWREDSPSIEVYKRPETDSVPTTPEIDWSKAPEGYDYWIVPNIEWVYSYFYYLKDGKFCNQYGFSWSEGNPSIEVYKRPEIVLPNVPCNDKGVSSKWKYEPIGDTSIFDLHEDLKAGNLYFQDHNQGNSDGMVQIVDEVTLATLIVEQDEICRKVEVKWQDEVGEYLQGCHSGQGMFDIVYGNGNELALSDEDFLEAARIALRGVGEYDEK